MHNEVQKKLEKAFKEMEELESKFDTMEVHSLLVVVGTFLHDTIDYNNLFQSIQQYDHFKNLHIDARTTSLEEDLKNDNYEMTDEFYEQMILHRRKIEETQILNIQQMERLKKMARLALETAVHKSKTNGELLQCAKYIEFELDDRNWADEIKEKVKAEN